MSKKMEIHGSAWVEQDVDVTIEVDAREIADFIEGYADDEDIEVIRTALAKRDGSKNRNTLEYDLKRDIAERIVERYSLYELIKLEKELNNGVAA